MYLRSRLFSKLISFFSDVKFLKFFIRELEKSAEFLEMYSVKTGFVSAYYVFLGLQIVYVIQ
jgi:hypothetical protein